MYKLSVPIMAATVTEENREIYAQQCKVAGVNRVFLCVSAPTDPIVPKLAEKIAFFHQQAFEVGVWTDTIGHGVILKHVESAEVSRFPQIVDITGTVRHAANCPLDKDFQALVATRIATYAKMGADVVMLDDDFRMSQHGENLCCACDAHLARIAEILGESISREELQRRAFTGKANKYRDAWLKAQNDGLVEFAQAIRREVDKESPDVTVCTCTAYAPWNVDGTDVEGISRILAGKNDPILRLTGAPYWATKAFTFPLITVFEIARMLASFSKDWGFDLMSEGDVYPRPRYTCPASYLELYDAVTRIDGNYTGILKYMFDYVAGPMLETGYLKLHQTSAPFYRAIPSLFPEGANAGVRVVSRPHTMKDADLDLSSYTLRSPRPTDGTMLGSCGIPTVYVGDGVCKSVFGENARLLDLVELSGGVILDAVSAVILTEKGVDVGLASVGALETDEISFLATDDPDYKSYISDGKARVLSASLRETAVPVLYSVLGSRKKPFAYRYENADGNRFLVFLFEGDSLHSSRGVCLSGILNNYAVQNVLASTLPWIARRPLPAYALGNPNLYLMCAKDEASLSVALFNCFADPLTEPTVYLDGSYSRIECTSCEAVLEGDRVRLTSTLHGFTSAAFRVFR